MSSRRLPALVFIVVALAALVVAGSQGHGNDLAEFGRASGAALPEVDPSGAVSSTWYCPVGTATKGGLANLSVVLANIGDTERSGTIAWIPATGEGRQVVPVKVGANSTVTLKATDAIEAPAVSALLELDGGGVAVEHTISGARGSAVAPCASSASKEWYFANGITERDAIQVLGLFNPFPDDAVVDVSFATDEGRVEPRALQGLPVPAGTTSVVRLQDVVRRRGVTALAVVARTGRLIVNRIQSFDSSAGRLGVSLALAAPALSEVWRFPDGFYEPGLSEAWHIYNPNDHDAQVSVEVVPSTGEAPEPLDLVIEPHAQRTVDPASTQLVGAGVPHATTIRSLNGVPIVAERAMDARSPSPRRGWSSALGAPVTARQWVFAAGEATERTDEWIVVQNPGAREVHVSVSALVFGQRLPIEDLQHLTVGPAGRLALRLGDHISRTPLPVLVEADRPVVAERDAYGVFRTGFSTIIGIPVR